MVLSGVINVDDISQNFINQIRNQIEEFKKNVIEKHYNNNFKQVRDFEAKLTKEVSSFYQENQGNMSPEKLDEVVLLVSQLTSYVTWMAREVDMEVKRPSNGDDFLLKTRGMFDELTIEVNDFLKDSWERKIVSKTTAMIVSDLDRLTSLINYLTNDKFRNILNVVDHNINHAGDVPKQTRDYLHELEESLVEFYTENKENLSSVQYARIMEILGKMVKNYEWLMAEDHRKILDPQNNEESLIQNEEEKELFLIQNKFIEHATLYEHLEKCIKYLEEVSTHKKSELQSQSQYGVTDAMINDFFVTCENEFGEEVSIVREQAEAYKKFVSIKKNCNQLLAETHKKLEKIYNEQIENMEPIDLGDINPITVSLEDAILTTESLHNGITMLLGEISNLNQEEGRKEKYQFRFNEQDYIALVPIHKKADFENLLQSLASKQMVLNNRNQLPELRNSEHFEVVEEYKDIRIDHQLFSTLTNHQKVSYLQTIMLQIENSNYKNKMDITDIKGHAKQIPAYYYNVYQECIDTLYDLSLDANLYDVKHLSTDGKRNVYQQLMDHLCSIQQYPMVVIDGKNVPARYADKYFEFKKELLALTQPLELDAQKDDGLHGYLIDEDYVKTLNDNLKLSYYSGLIGKASQCPLEPKVGYEAFGVKMHIPVSLLTTVQECERLTKEYMQKNELIINEMEVNARTPEMQFVYYGRIIEKMRRSTKGPKTKVEAFGESFEIPYECLDTFHECLNRMGDLRRAMNVAHFKNNPRSAKPRKRYKIKKVRKPFTTKVKEAFKKLSYKTKVAIALGVSAVTSFAFGFVNGYYQNLSSPNLVHEETSVHQVSNSATESVINDALNSVATDTDQQIDSWINAAKQSIASHFGSTYTLKGHNIYLNKDDKDPKEINEVYQNQVYTIVSVVLDIPGIGVQEVNYQKPSAQTYVDELIQKGAKIVRVSGVAQNAENHYFEHGISTGYFDIDEIDMIDYANRSTTNLSQMITEQMNQQKGVSR